MPAVFERYLARLGVETGPPTVERLFAIHRAQVERVPYETTWIHLGETWDVATDRAVERIADQARGGYCFHLNGSMAALLAHLGYTTTLHVGGVHGPDGPAPADLTNHLVVTVSDLPGPGNPGGAWYLDAGLGDALYEPLPLVAGTYRQGPLTFVLTETPGGVGDWHLTHDPRGSFTGMSFGMAPATLDQFAERHRHLSTSSDSGFVRTVTVQRRDAGGVDVLRGLVLTRLDADPPADGTVISDRTEWFELLRDHFGLRLAGVDEPARDRLWSSAVASHDAWERQPRV